LSPRSASPRRRSHRRRLAPQVGGLLLDANFGVGSNFLAFSIAAGLAVILLSITAVVTKPAVSARPVADLLVN